MVVIGDYFTIFLKLSIALLFKELMHVFSASGVVTPNLFDQLETASFIGGFHASIRGSAPAMSHYISTGLEPFVAVYSAVEVQHLHTLLT